jgi:hypothetical protein
MSHFVVFEHHLKSIRWRLDPLCSWMMFNQDIHQSLLNPINPDVAPMKIPLSWSIFCNPHVPY